MDGSKDARHQLAHGLTLSNSMASCGAVASKATTSAACKPASLAARLEALRQQALALNSSCRSGSFGFGQTYAEARMSVCESLQADVDMAWFTMGIVGILCMWMPVMVCCAMSRDAARLLEVQVQEDEQAAREQLLIRFANAPSMRSTSYTLCAASAPLWLSVA